MGEAEKRFAVFGKTFRAWGSRVCGISKIGTIGRGVFRSSPFCLFFQDCESSRRAVTSRVCDGEQVFAGFGARCELVVVVGLAEILAVDIPVQDRVMVAMGGFHDEGAGVSVDLDGNEYVCAGLGKDDGEIGTRGGP